MGRAVASVGTRSDNMALNVTSQMGMREVDLVARYLASSPLVSSSDFNWTCLQKVTIAMVLSSDSVTIPQLNMIDSLVQNR